MQSKWIFFSQIVNRRCDDNKYLTLFDPTWSEIRQSFVLIQFNFSLAENINCFEYTVLSRHNTAKQSINKACITLMFSRRRQLHG
jgi:hypothetical protein